MSCTTSTHNITHTDTKEYNYIMDRLSPAHTHEPDQGFSDEEKQPQIIIRDKNPYDFVSSSTPINPYTSRAKFQEPRAKLKYVRIANDQNAPQKSLAQKQFRSRSCMTKSFQFPKKDQIKESSLFETVINSKRTLIGQNIIISNAALQQSLILKQRIRAQGLPIVFQSPQEPNTHGLIKRIVEAETPSLHFLNSKYNNLLKSKIKYSLIVSKKQTDTFMPSSVTFRSDMECANLQYVFQSKNLEYDLYLKSDTNSHGHQNWFYFQVTNPNNNDLNVKFKICNLKRPFKMVEEGQKIFVKNMRNFQSNWILAGNNISVQSNKDEKIGKNKFYKLSFSLQLKANSTVRIATLPVYTYSQILRKVQNLQTINKKIICTEILGYSLTGLAIPLITITNKQIKDEQKKVILISSRIHPGETVCSFVAEGLMSKLTDLKDSSIIEMLNATIIKIIPILNPDGVIFGNFRTNFLGIDLNRAFCTSSNSNSYSDFDDEILNPQIHALKTLAKQLKQKHGNNFVYFFDLHGHSSQKNIFSYGPNFQQNHSNFHLSRIIPRLLCQKSKYFDFPSCTFKLQSHKANTARGFFLNQLNIMAYTIQSSYAIYQSNGNKLQMNTQDWINFGQQMALCLSSALKIVKNNVIRNIRELKSVLSLHDSQQLKATNKITDPVISIKRQQSKQQQIDSDAESEAEDLTKEQRTETEKKILQFGIQTFSLPKVVKPAILYPTVTPKLFQITQKTSEIKILYTKRVKYGSLRMPNLNSPIGSSINSVNMSDLEALRPQGKNIKLDRKFE